MAEASGWRQFRLLLWKDYLIRKRKLITLGGVVWATLVVLSLYFVRVNINNEDHPTCQFTARALPSAGMLTFLQSFICNVNNPCTSMDQYEEIPTYENSKLTQIQRQFMPLLYNETILDTAGAVPDALKLLGTLTVAADEPTFLNIVKNGLKVKELFKNPRRVKKSILVTKLNMSNDDAEAIMRAEISLQGILKGSMDICNPDSLSEIILVGQPIAYNLSMAICQMSNDELQHLLFSMVVEVDITKYVKMLGNMYSKLNGDNRITELANTITAVLRITRLESFIPPELVSLFAGGSVDEQFRYFNLTILSKLLDLFEPTFGETEAFKSAKGISDAAISAIQWLYRVYSKQANVDPVNEVTELVLRNVDENLRLPGMEKVSSRLQKNMEIFEQNIEGIISMDEIFDILPRVMYFFMRWIPKEMKHQIFFYSTLLTKLMEGSHKVIIDNIKLEQIVYNASLRNPEGVKILTKLPLKVVAKAFEALSDADRAQMLTMKLNNHDQMFCDEVRLEKFFQISVKEVLVVKKLLCTDEWNNFMIDLIESFGIIEVKNNINTMASLLIQETLGKDTDDQLYPLEKGFQVIKDLIKDLLKLGYNSKVRLDWNTLLGVTDDSEFMAVIREKQHLGTQVLITVHGALAKEIVKQNTILDLKITPLLIDVTTLIIAINNQLEEANKTSVVNFKKAYPQVLATMLTTMLDEEKTYALLSTYNSEIFCDGVETASKYLKFPFDMGSGSMISALCDMTKEIDKGLQSQSLIAKAINVIQTSSSHSYGSVEWTKLITGLKNLYITIQKDYPYILAFSSYGMDRDMKMTVDQLIKKNQVFWFGKESVNKSVQLSMNILFRFLDLLDKGAFNFTNNVWLKMKYSLTSANSLMVITDEIIKLITATTTSMVFESGLPPSTTVALKMILPNIPQLIIDISEIIAKDNADEKNIIDLMNSEQAWPCSLTSLSDVLNLSAQSVKAVNGLESIICMNVTFQQEWITYGHAQQVRMIMSMDKFNKTKYDPQLFLKFSKNFNSIIRDTKSLKKVLENVFNDNSTAVDSPTFLTAWRHAIEVFNTTEKEVIFRKLFTKVDKILNSINTTSARDSSSLSTMWDDYLQCTNQTIIQCSSLARMTWKNTLMFFSTITNSIAEDLLLYFTEINEPNANIFQIIGFTKKTGLYILYEKLGDFVGVLLNSYWDYGFMNQIRRASKSEFWDCEAVVDALVIPPGSLITPEDIRKVRPYICPSLLYWVSLPRGENSLLDVVSKPQYYFYTMAVQNLTSNYSSAYNLYLNLSNLLKEISMKNDTIILKEENLQIETLQNNIHNFFENVLTWKLNETDPSYRLFHQINRNQFLSSVYLTRVITVVSKIQIILNNMPEKLKGKIKPDEMKLFEADLQVILKKFKRRPSEVIALHFDLLTDILRNNQGNYLLTEALQSRCKNLDSKYILAEDNRFLSQICAKKYDIIYGSVDQELAIDFINAKQTLDDFVEGTEVGNLNVYEFFKDRKDVTNSLKLSIKYADELGLPIYLKYLQNNLKQYNIVLSFLAGEDWWSLLRKTYDDTITSMFFDTLENLVDSFENIMTHLDQIHLVRLLRDINFNDTASFCQSNVSISDYIPDSGERFSKLKQLVCEVEDIKLYLQLPIMLIVSQGYDNRLTLPKEIDYVSLYAYMNKTEEKLSAVKTGPKSPTLPQWITQEKLHIVSRVANEIFSKDSLTKVSFGVLSNVVDASTLFLNNSQCSFCSKLTTWFKQLNLQLFKKQDYDNLICHIEDMSLEDVYHTLKNDFHWDMTLKELISTRNYTNLELNKALNEFLEQIKLLVLDDVMSIQSKLSDCLLRNISKNAFGNATLFVSVLSHSLKLLRAQLPHIQEVAEIKNVDFMKQMFTDIAPNLPIDRPLKIILKNRDFMEQLNKIVIDTKIIHEVEGSTVNLMKLKTDPNKINIWMKLQNSDWGQVCQTLNCTELALMIHSNVDENWIDSKLTTLQTEEFWRFNFISSMVHHVEEMLQHISRLLGVASKMDLVGAFNGHLSAFLDLILQIMQEDTMNIVLYSLEGFAEGLHPLLKNTELDFDMIALLKGLQILRELRAYVTTNVDLKLEVPRVFTNHERIESGMSRLGINNTNFWSLAAPRIQYGFIDLKPLITTKMDTYHISTFVCQVEELSEVIIPSNLDDMVLLDDIYGAVIEQFCMLADVQAKQVVPVLIENLNFGFIMEKVLKLILVQVNKASNLTQEEGDVVLSKYKDMMNLIPIVQKNVGNLTESLFKEPVFDALKNFESVGGLLSSSSFLSSAGNMLCGKPFEGNGNRFYKAIAETKDFSNQPDPAQLEVLPSDFCRSLYTDILKMGGGKIVWSFVKPLIMGKILFTPDTPAVQRIVEKANSSFATAARLTGMVHKFANSFPSVQLMAKHRGGVEALKSLASSHVFGDLMMENSGDFDVGSLLDDFGDLQINVGVSNLLTKASNLLECINLNRFHEMTDEKELTHEAVKLTRVNEFSAGLVFMNVEENEERPVNVEYKIRMDIDSVPTTSRIRNQFWTPGPEANFLEDMRYFRGFVQIQDLVDKAIIDLSHNATHGRIRKRETVTEDFKYDVYTQQIPYPCYRRDYFQSSLYESQALIVAFFFALLFTVSSAIRFIVSEKESGNTMLMSVMGVNLTNHTLSWFVTSFVELTVTCVCVCVVLCAGGVLPRTDPTLLMALLINFAFSTLMFCYLVSKLFSSASLAAVCGGLGYMVTFMPFVIILSLEAVLTFPTKLLTSLSMSTAFCYSVLHIARLEAAGEGARWADVGRELGGDRMTIAVTALCVFVDGLIYLALGCLLDRFFGIKTLKSNITNCVTSTEKSGVSIVNVSKVYNEGTRRAKVALDNVSIELQQGQITALLGHNGAGKTTLLKIMTGMLKPSSGGVVIRTRREPHGGHGRHAGHGTHAALGVCPQHDVLFDALTAREHIALYAQLKSGLPAEEVEEEVESMMQTLSFTASEGGCAASRLSGGLRRRLCVALGFVSRPRLVLLDEPASGVDPNHTRDIWSLIMKLKEDRTILLTTHHLEEAELLSDQVVIMHKGQIHTSGSPIDIKRSLGNGYNLTVQYPIKDHDPDQDLGEDNSIEELTKLLLTTVKKVVKNAQLVDVNGLEVEINLPFFDGSGLNNDFLRLSTSLESQQPELGFKRYLMDCSSLEQILYNICSQHDEQPQYLNGDEDSPTHSASSSITKMDSPLVPDTCPLKGSNMQQFKAFLYKRYLHYTRNRWLLFLLLVLPSLFVSIAMAFSMIRPPADNEIALRLTPDLYLNATQFIMPAPSIYSTDLDPSLAESVMMLIKQAKMYSNWTDDDSPSCECTDVRQNCEYKVKRNELPEMMVLPDIDVLNEWLIASQQEYIEKRYGGFTSALKNNITSFLVWYNNKGHHAMPSFVNSLHAALLKRASGDPTADIRTYTHPLKISHEQLSKSTLLQHVADAGISGMLLLGYSLIPAGAAIYLVQERRTQQKRLQLLCGVSPILYWGAAMLWDLLIIVLNIGITVCVLTAFGFPVFIARDNLPAICLLLFLFGLSCNSLVHVLEKLFTDPSMANMILFCGNTFIGLSGLAILLILDIISESDATDNARWTLHKIFLLSPQFALGDALLEIAKNTVQAQVLSRFGMDTYVSPLRDSLISYHYIALVLLAVFLIALNMAIEYDLFEPLSRIRLRRAKSSSEADEEDVLAERRRVESHQNIARPLKLHTLGNINNGYITTEKREIHRLTTPRDVAHCVSLTRYYRTRAAPALQDLTLGVMPGQCTALVGENGAGKSTTFALFSGELRPSSGLLRLPDKTKGLISYCPQTNAIDPLLTVEETLRFYCQLRGITEEKDVIKRTIEIFDLTKYRHVRNEALSGGNKRKLCTAVAFMGRSSMILLDEPTSGMDPGSRGCVSRGIRTACACAGGGSRAVLLSTHVLRDASRLASRVAVLRAGRLRALAQIDDCLQRFGGGTSISVRARSGVSAWRALRVRAPHAELRALHAHAAQVHLPARAQPANDIKEIDMSLSDIFRLLAEMQAAGDIEDYTVNQSSLDEMFLHFSNKKDTDPEVCIDPLPSSLNDPLSEDFNSVTSF